MIFKIQVGERQEFHRERQRARDREYWHAHLKRFKLKTSGTVGTVRTVSFRPPFIAALPF